MLSQNLFTLLSIFLLISGISSTALNHQSISKRAIPDGLYTSCHSAVVRQGCNSALDAAYADGRIRRFTTAHQYLQLNGCKLSWWSDSGVAHANSKEPLRAALQQIDDACTASGVSTVNKDNLPGRGVYVGQLLGNQYVVLKAELGQFPPQAGV